MASHLHFCISIFTILSFLTTPSHSDSDSLFLSPTEQDSLYKVLESINSAIPWRSLYPDDLCNFGPDGILCDYFTNPNNNTTEEESLHVTELKFGYVSEYLPNIPCTSNSTISPPHLFSFFPSLRKLFFYKCFTQTPQPSLPLNLPNSLQELIFVENPSLSGSLSGIFSNLNSLTKLVLSGTNISGSLPAEIGDSVGLEQITLTRSRLNGEIPSSIGKLKKLKFLDLSYNGFEGNLPDSIGGLKELVKIDLGYNRLTGRIPESLGAWKKLEFLDFSYNRFGNFGIPLCLGEMTGLKEVYLSGNKLGGQIPEIWRRLGGILGLGLSDMGLVGKIPSSMGVYLRNLSYLGLENNKLEGRVPEEFWGNVNEMNLENNLLSGRVVLGIGKNGGKLKLGGNEELCVDEEDERAFSKSRRSRIGKLKVCKKSDIDSHVLLSRGSSGSSYSLCLFVLLFGCFCLYII